MRQGTTVGIYCKKLNPISFLFHSANDTQMLECLDPLLIRKIALMACNTALLSTCKEIFDATTLNDRILMAMRENDRVPGTALYMASSAGVKVEIVQFLLDSVLVFDKDGLYVGVAFCRACSQGHLHIVKCFLEAGANVHFRDDCALMDACRNGRTAVVDHLLNAGADVSAQNNWVFVYAKRYPSIVKRLRYAALCAKRARKQ